jgi:hypothetical protein
MAIYGYRCRECGETRESGSRDDVQECSCGGVSRRDFSTVQLRPVAAFQPHFNHSVGRYVHSSRDFDRALKRAAEDNTEQTGIEHSYTRFDPGDAPVPDKDTEAIEHGQRKIHDENVRVFS